jgi:hypothetical protein
LFEAVAFDALGHHRGGGLADRAAAATEGDVADSVVVDVEAEDDLVTAERVVAAGGDIGRVELAAVAGVLVVVEDDFFVEVVE